MREVTLHASFLEGLWPLRPWKFEAITGILSLERKLHPRPSGQVVHLPGATPDAWPSPPPRFSPAPPPCGGSGRRADYRPLPGRGWLKTLCPKALHLHGGGSPSRPRVAQSRSEAPLEEGLLRCLLTCEVLFRIMPQVRGGGTPAEFGLISISGGEETYKDSPSNGKAKEPGRAQDENRAAFAARITGCPPPRPDAKSQFWNGARERRVKECLNCPGGEADGSAWSSADSSRPGRRLASIDGSRRPKPWMMIHRRHVASAVEAATTRTWFCGTPAWRPPAGWLYSIRRKHDHESGYKVKPRPPNPKAQGS
ncbi:hypothetical protein H6P81_021697 [Aristolochia fimbriata]|uniref:Uncharacterized protein n=1 Tax=Aristolochia fimbriata TaxID=158543 RepID=A0AAV7DRU8_ARIFI|nr:hypothetical protein H6P81_021697 [Aristolochia fimbriata]